MQQARAQFPAVMAGETVFLDNASGAQLPQVVLDAMLEAMQEMQVNKGGRYPASRRVTDGKEHARVRTADFLGVAHDAEGVAFGANATTLMFLLAEAVADTLQSGDEIIVTGLDHHANRDPWLRLARRGVTVKTWEPREPDGILMVDDLAAMLSEKTRVVAMTAASNLVGTLGPVAEVGKLLQAHRARLVVDAVHYAPHHLPDAEAWGADAVAFSPYKVFAPHLGALWIRDSWRRELPDWGLSFLPAGPSRWEPGTQNHEAILAFAAALDYLAWLGEGAGAPSGSSEREFWRYAFSAIVQYERALLENLLQGIRATSSTLYGLGDISGRTATVAFRLPGVAPSEVAEHLGTHSIAVTAGHAYAEHLASKHFGLEEGVVRVSLLHYSDQSDLSRLFSALSELG